MSEKGEILFEKKWIDRPLKIYQNGIETDYISSAGYFGSKTIREFKNVNEFTDIYSFEWKTKGISFNSGIQLETADRKIAIISFNECKKEIIMPLIDKLFGNIWDNIYHKNEILEKFKSPGKIGQVGVHHLWQYNGNIKGWE